MYHDMAVTKNIVSPERWIARGFAYWAICLMCCPPLWLACFGLVLSIPFNGPTWAYIKPDLVNHVSDALTLAISSLAACLLVNWLCRVEPAEKVARRCAVMSAKGVPDALIKGKLEVYIERLYFIRYHLGYVIFIGGGTLFGWIATKYSDTNFPLVFIVFWTFTTALISALGHHLDIRIPLEAARKKPQPVPFGKAAKTSDQRLREIGMI
jgi:hypothetical protein